MCEKIFSLSLFLRYCHPAESICITKEKMTCMREELYISRITTIMFHLLGNLLKKCIIATPFKCVRLLNFFTINRSEEPQGSTRCQVGL